MTEPSPRKRPNRRARLTRRRFVSLAPKAALVAAGAGVVGWKVLDRSGPPIDAGAFPPVSDARVAAVRVSSYDVDLDAVIEEGIRTVGADVEGKRVLVKPNLVEFDAGTSINTDPRVVAGAVVALRRLGASEVVVGEGPGHRRDTEYVVTASGLWDALDDVDAPFIDLNVAAIRQVSLNAHFTELGELWLPEPVLDADLVVSIPKMKCHHWVGVTLSMKNLFGVLPGRVYGWPKNVLHWQGIPNSILDLNSAVRPELVIVDGITGMEGDGPIMGTPVDSGHLVFGTDPVATDTTAARLMGIDPTRIEYLAAAGEFLGQANYERIEQLGEDPEADAIEFELVPEFSFLRYGSPDDRQERDSRGG